MEKESWIKVFVRDALNKSSKEYKLCTIKEKSHITLEEAYGAAQAYLEEVVGEDSGTDYYICRMELSDGNKYNYGRYDRETYKNEYCKWAEKMA